MLREPTNRIWQALSIRPELDGFILIGGSALALHLHHRLSEDLDFAWPHPRLPRESLHRLTTADAGLHFKSTQDAWAEREAIDAGFDLDDSSHDYLINEEVKVTFICPDVPERKILSAINTTSLRIASVPEIFALKAMVIAKRARTRDWFDLYVLMKDHGFSWKDFYSAFVQAGNEGQYDFAAMRLSSMSPPKDDEGYQSLLPNPPTIDEMRAFFLDRRNRYERGE